VLAGVTRAFLSVGIIIVIGLLSGIFLSYGPVFWLAVFLNGFFFASLAVCLAMLVKSHADQALLTNFFITPMAFLGGTFFPLDRMPPWVQTVLHFLPLTHAAKAIRSAAFGAPPEVFSILLLAGMGVVLFILAFLCVNRAKE
jgi:ABC-2 type transport system permease protein